MIFLDTSGIYAAADVRDEYHSTAAAHLEEIINSGEVALTHDWVVAECASLLQSRLGLAAATAFLRDLSNFRIEWMNPELAGEAIALHSAQQRRDLSLVDCASFVVMRRLGISTYFGYDVHFRERGFRPYPGL